MNFIYITLPGLNPCLPLTHTAMSWWLCFLPHLKSGKFENVPQLITGKTGFILKLWRKIVEMTGSVI